MEPQVTPAECALAIALPLTFDEFARDAASPDKDFVKRLVDGSGRALRAAWDELYRRKVVALCAKVAERARGLSRDPTCEPGSNSPQGFEPRRRQ